MAASKTVTATFHYDSNGEKVWDQTKAELYAERKRISDENREKVEGWWSAATRVAVKTFNKLEKDGDLGEDKKSDPKVAVVKINKLNDSKSWHLKNRVPNWSKTARGLTRIIDSGKGFEVNLKVAAAFAKKLGTGFSVQTI